eukprot:g23401.t1
MVELHVVRCEPKIVVVVILTGTELGYQFLLSDSVLLCTLRKMRQRNYTTYTYSKNRKYEKLGITTSRYQVSPGTTVETGTTTGKSIVNLSDHTLQTDKIKVPSQGVNFCPATKIDPLGLAADTEEFIRRMRLWDFFHKLQAVSSESNQTTNEPEQLAERSAVQGPKEEK